MDIDYTFEIAGLRFGFQRNYIGRLGKLYMIQHILYLGWLNFRAHKFYRGDDDRAPHDHPWWFITFPLKTYIEDVFVSNYGNWGEPDFESYSYPRLVKAWRFHYRPATYRHIVRGSGEPFWTFVIADRPSRPWGFWPRPDRFVPWREWK